MSYPHDLVVVVPDGAICLVAQTLVIQRRLSMGIREVDVELVKDPLHDASPESKVVMLLRGYLRTHKHAMVIRDLAGSGWEKRGAGALREALLRALTENGWEPHRIQAIILEPELEAWLRLTSVHVQKLVNDRARRNAGFSSLLFTDQVRQIVTELGGESRGKPRQPKECFEHILAFYGIPRSNALYRELARRESLDGCVVVSFKEFVQTLHGWFPSEGGP
jgi:hypothetical protein